MHPLNMSRMDNSFTRDLAAGLVRLGIVVEPFSRRRAFTSAPDIVHIHWPEALVSHPVRLMANLKALVFFFAIITWRLRRTRLVATVHNITPHEDLAGVRSRIVDFWWRSADERVYLSDEVRKQAPMGPGTFVPHQSYSPLASANTEHAGHILLFGFLRRYKSIESVISASARTESPVPVRIVGAPIPSAYGDELVAQCAALSNVTIELGALDDEDLHRAVAQASAVIVPYPHLYSSGAVILAMSVGVPVILVDSPVARELQQEFGRDAVSLLPEGWGGADLESAYRWSVSAPRPVGESSIAARNPDSIAFRYSAIYRGET
ncbi:MAG: glycosyltransferase, partial [Alphaproteobacteria bacterium]